MRIQDALDRFLLQLQADGRSPHTVGQYRRHIARFTVWAALDAPHGDVAGIDHETLARFLASPAALTRPDGLSKKPTTVNALRSSLRGFFQYLYRAGIVEIDAGRLIRHAICGEPPPKTMSKQDQECLLCTLTRAKGRSAERDHALFLMLLRTGVRIGSALAIEVNDFDLDRGEVLLRRCKGGQIQRIFLPNEVRDHMRRFLEGRTAGFVFHNRRGQPITTRHAQRRLSYWLMKSGVKPVSPHCLRHSFAMSFYRRTRDLSLVQKALGHRSIASTMRYARATDDDLRVAMGALV